MGDEGGDHGDEPPHTHRTALQDLKEGDAPRRDGEIWGERWGGDQELLHAEACHLQLHGDHVETPRPQLPHLHEPLAGEGDIQLLPHLGVTDNEGEDEAGGASNRDPVNVIQR